MIALILLGIDTSGKTASVAVCDEENVLAQTSVLTRLTHSQVIMPICNDVLRNAGISLQNVDAMVVSNGPGSYTGLRIGISAVKAMSFAMKKKCLGVSTLESLAYNMRGFHGVICTVMKARLDLMYTAFFTSHMNEIHRILDDSILAEKDIIDRIKSYHGDIVLVGDGAKELYLAGGLSELENVVLAAPHLRLQLASSLCYASFEKQFGTAENLNAEYLQVTKAEKDLMEGMQKAN
jgi:tRNA threonylcarbamoyladenosine biosynthesis protein TsaB